MDLYTEQIQISSIFDYICILRITVMLSFIALLTLGRVAQVATSYVAISILLKFNYQ
jgi:hypothetical protein